MTTQHLAYANSEAFNDRGAQSFNETEVRYRADIDGLRALAVVPVVLFHAGSRWFQGGYVGVDVFFVISGFLITSILAREIADQTYSILKFYRRRALRIFPALAAMTLATMVVSFFVITPAEYVDVAKSALAVSVFSSNFYFWKSVSYFQSANAFQPLLHTWSLAVEEQYYVFFPVLLWLLSPRRIVIVGALWLIFITSLGLAVLLVPQKPNLAFYMLPTRAWELMLGGIIAIGGLPRPTSVRLASFASLIGVALITVPMVVYTADTPFPGMAAVPPTVGTALVIWSGGKGVVADILSKRAIVAVGQASYSIYLWHLPLLSFANYLAGGHLAPIVAFILCAVAVAMGFASLAIIERPFRFSPHKRNRMAISACIAMVGVALVSSVVILAHGLPARLSEYDASIVATAADKYKHHAECMTVDQSIVAPEHACHLGTPNAAPTILLWGDSHAMVSATALELAALRHHGAFLFAADADCPPGLGFDIDPRFDPKLTAQLSYRYCSEYNRQMLNVALASPGIKTVVLSSRWTNWRIGEPPNVSESGADIRLRDSSGTAESIYANKEKWVRGFVELINELTAAGKHVVIVGPVPEPRFDVPHELHIEQFGFVTRSQPITVAEYRRRHRSILGIFAGLEEKPGVSFVWPYDALCAEDKCPLVQHGGVMFFDQDHLSVYGARQTARLYEPLFK